MSKVSISVVIPCYDEMANLQKGVLDKVQHFLDRKKITYEVIIADDGSTDGSVAFIEKFCKENPHFHLIKNPHFGKAGAVTTGMLKATGKYRIFTDMDQATPIEEIDKLLPYLESGEYSVAIGSRDSIRKGAPFERLLISKASILLRKYIVGMHKISDTQCGFKMFTGESAEDIFTKFKKLKKGFKKINGTAITYGSDIEMLYLADQNGYRIKEVPVEWLHVETRRVNPLRDSIQGVADLLRIKQNITDNKYKDL